jgi:hypothetical protein
MQCNVEFGYKLSICSRTEENHGNPISSCRAQDFSDANGLLASSPTLNTRTLTLVPICAVAVFEKKKFTYLSLQICLSVSILWMSTKQLCVNTCVENTCLYARKQIYVISNSSVPTS